MGGTRPADYERIRSLYASFASAKEDTVRAFLREVAFSENGFNVTLGLCPKTQGGRLVPHIIPLHSLGIGPLFEEDASKDLYTIGPQTPFQGRCNSLSLWNPLEY